jgi:hypothetical protein
MKKLLVFTWVLLAISIYSSTSQAQGTASPSGEKIALVIGNYDARAKSIELTAIVPAAKVTKANRGKSMIEARARTDGDNMIIDLTSTLPQRSEKLVVASALSLRQVGGICYAVKPGTYAINSATKSNGSATLACFDVNTDPTIVRTDSTSRKPHHRLFRTTYRVDQCPRW